MDPRGKDVYEGNARLTTDATRRNTAVRLLTDWGFVRRLVRFALGLPVPVETEDRRVLEQVVFPYLAAQPTIKRILFVGCSWYTKHYERAFFRAREFWTMDIDPAARKFAGKHHIVAGLEQLADHFPKNHFDLLICNGVYGFGLDSREQCESAFAECYARLVPDGYFLFGWTDVTARTPVPLESIESLRQFRRYPLEIFGGSWRLVTDTPYRHTYEMYRK